LFLKISARLGIRRTKEIARPDAVTIGASKEARGSSVVCSVRSCVDPVISGFFSCEN